jgi:hypothetical protein
LEFVLCAFQGFFEVWFGEGQFHGDDREDSGEGMIARKARPVSAEEPCAIQSATEGPKKLPQLPRALTKAMPERETRLLRLGELPGGAKSYERDGLHALVIGRFAVEYVGQAF